ncbi:MAG: Gfo/Idh/MocA family protein [Candidatus Tyrphobacter sp.]
MKKPYALGLVGTGAIGAMHAKTVATLDGVQLVAACDTNAASLAAATEITGARGYERYRDLVFEERLDGIVVCTPPVTHPEIARFFLERGVDVLCEKPLAIDAASAQEMYDAARRNGRLLMLASKFRYVPDIAGARRLIAEGALGKIRHAEIVFISNVDMRSRWNSDPAQSGGGVIIDNGPHAADITRYLFGPVTHVAAVGYARDERLSVEDSAYLYLGTQNAGVAVDLSWSLDRKFPYYVRVFGERGRLCLGWQQSTLSVGPSGVTTPIGPGYSKTDAFAALQTDFVRASSGRGKPRIDAASALGSVDVIEAAYASIRDGGRTAVGAPERIAV